jgi:hypothetical protein
VEALAPVVADMIEGTIQERRRIAQWVLRWGWEYVAVVEALGLVGVDMIEGVIEGTMEVGRRTAQ